MRKTVYVESFDVHVKREQERIKALQKSVVQTCGRRYAGKSMFIPYLKVYAANTIPSIIPRSLATLTSQHAGTCPISPWPLAVQITTCIQPARIHQKTAASRLAAGHNSAVVTPRK